MSFNLLPKEYEFFNLLDILSYECIHASKQFSTMIRNRELNDIEVKKLKDIERVADTAVFDLVEKLDNSFITPLAKKDMYELANEMDSIIDLHLKLANIMKSYKITEINHNFFQVVDLIEKSVDAVSKSVNGLRTMKNVSEIKIAIAEANRIEDEGDQLRNDIIAELFSESTDAIYIMKWKDIFQTTEKILDKCDEVAKIVESILVKQE